MDKAYASRIKKERKTIKDGDDILKSIVDALKEGKSAYGFTMGKISLIQIVETICNNFGGNFNFKTCVWSANKIDILRLKNLQNKGRIKETKLLIDPSAYTRKFEAVEAIYQCFGKESVRTIPTHAKFVTLESDKYKIAITSSMNFTHNPRIEQYEISECSDTVELMSDMVNNAFKELSTSENFTSQSLKMYKKIEENLQESSPFDIKINTELNFNISI
jgi:hypothetical protein